MLSPALCPTSVQLAGQDAVKLDDQQRPVSPRSPHPLHPGLVSALRLPRQDPLQTTLQWVAFQRLGLHSTEWLMIGASVSQLGYPSRTPGGPRGVARGSASECQKIIKNWGDWFQEIVYKSWHCFFLVIQFIFSHSPYFYTDSNIMCTLCKL